MYIRFWDMHLILQISQLEKLFLPQPYVIAKTETVTCKFDISLGLAFGDDSIVLVTTQYPRRVLKQ